VADQDGFFKIEISSKGGYVAAEVLDGDLLRPARGLAMGAQVARHDFVRLREKTQLMAPVFVAAEEAVHEDQGRGAPPLADEVQT
jgi:hypothetical protein